MSLAGAPASQPLDVLTAEEIEAAVAVVRASGRLSETARFSYIALQEPPKAEVLAHRPGRPVRRRVRVQIVLGPGLDMVEAVVVLGQGRDADELESWTPVPGMRPALLFEESFGAIVAVMENPDWQAALARRGVTDFGTAQIDPWPAGSFGLGHEDGRRIARCLTYIRATATDNGYARPVEGLIAFVDLGRAEVLEVVDYGLVPVPEAPGTYGAEDVGPLRSDLTPLEITQPEGPSFTLEGNLLRWQKWSLRVSMDTREGVVLHTVGYEDSGRVRSILYRASISEMVVPYGDPGPMHGWKNAFDVGEWGLGRFANSLSLGCDCLGEITYMDGLLADEHGNPYPLVNAVCIHEEDYGILWKHTDLNTGNVEVRRSRRLVVSFIATVGNYDYGFYWYLYQDGTIQLEVKLTGILSTQAVKPGERPDHAPLLTRDLAAPVHQHLFCARLDLDVDGADNEVHEVEAERLPSGPANPWGNGFRPRSTRLNTESEAARITDTALSRRWRVVNPGVRNAAGEPVAYQLVPGPVPTLLADPASSVGRRAAFATRNLWVTPYAATEMRAAGEYPNQHAGGDGLARWTQADRSLIGTDVVLWHTFGVTHFPRPEDWPVMPVEYTGFHLVPVGFFDRNPALDVPPPPGHCAAEADPAG
ncbi:MAG: primary-amine oxidase [Acidimicrobiales bacterium]